jgi:hypothetical protein
MRDIILVSGINYYYEISRAFEFSGIPFDASPNSLWNKYDKFLVFKEEMQSP